MFSPKVQPLLERDFVIVKIDTDRYEQGQAVLDELRASDKGGIPWFAFLEPDAKAPEDKSALGATILGNSNLMNGDNVGSPYRKQEIAAFEALLHQVCRKMAPKDFETLHETLVAQGEQPKPPVEAK